MRGKIAGALAVVAAVLTALGLGYTVGSDRRSDEFALVERQLAAEREEVEQLLAHCETLEPSIIEPLAGGAAGGAADAADASGAVRSWVARLTRGFPQRVEGTDYRVTVEDVRREPAGGHLVTVAVAGPRGRETGEIATGKTATVGGVAVTVAGADVAGARLVLSPL